MFWTDDGIWRGSDDFHNRNYNPPSLQTFSKLKKLKFNYHILMKRTVQRPESELLGGGEWKVEPY